MRMYYSMYIQISNGEIMGSMSFRFDKEMEEEFEFIQARLHISKTDVVKQALHILYSRLKKKKLEQSPAELLKQSGLIGSFEAESDLSVNYKKIIAEDINDKYE